MRIHLRKKHIISKKNIFIFTLILIFISLVFIINFIGNKITPGVVSYAETELEKFTTRIINSVISTEIKDISLEELFIITKDNNDYIKTIDYNPIVVNGVLSNITTKVDRLLRNVENGENLFELSNDVLENYDIEKLKKGIIFEMAITTIFDNPLLSNLGPRIPVRIFMLGSTSSNINTKITNYGINNALIETSIVIDLKLQIVLPYKTEKVSFQNSIPISLKLIQGIVPNYYFNGIDKNSSSFIVPK
ncbi:MAG: sporulation protein YunB [Firmicutes bacterium]|nr:sporulation protein YunB [Bacillota bacterium]